LYFEKTLALNYCVDLLFLANLTPPEVKRWGDYPFSFRPFAMIRLQVNTYNGGEKEVKEIKGTMAKTQARLADGRLFAASPAARETADVVVVTAAAAPNNKERNKVKQDKH